MDLAEPRSAIRGVAGILVWTGNYEPMVRFYCDVLGLQPRTRRERLTQFEWGAFRLSIGIHDEVSGPSADPLRIMINFEVSDIHAVYQRLRGAGVEFLRPPEQEKWGGWIATFHDPDGNTLQLLQPRAQPAD